MTYIPVAWWHYRQGDPMTTNTWISHDGGTTWRCTHRSLFTRDDIESAFLAWITDIRLNPGEYPDGTIEAALPSMSAIASAKAHTDHLIGLMRGGVAQCQTSS